MILQEVLDHKPPNEKVLVVALRNTDISSLFKCQFKTTLNTVFRLEKILI